MPVTYIMEAKENYSPAIVTLIQANTPPLWSYSDTQDCGIQFDFNGRNIVYAVMLPEHAPDLSINPNGNYSTNNSGFTLWDGVSLGAVAVLGTIATNGSTVEVALNWNLTLGFKNIDTDVVTFTSVFGSSNVPNGLGPSAHAPVLFNAGNPTSGQNIVLNGITWTFVTSGASGNQTNIQSTVNATAQQLAWDLNASTNASLTGAYYLSAPSSSYPTLNITYKTAGTAGNAYTLGAGSYGAGLVSSTLSSGLAGSDGTWLRMAGDTNVQGGSVPIVFDPHTQNVWIHVQSCVIYLFRKSDSYKQIISPFCPVYGVDNPNYPIGITSTWFFCFEQNNAGSPLLTPYDNILHMIPATIQSAETTLDKLLSFADFLYPALLNSAYFRQCLDHSGNFYVIGGQQSGTRNYKLWKFTPPSAAPWGGPVTGGGFTDITPWASGTGPNTNASGYTVNAIPAGVQQFDSNMLMYLPATQDLVAINVLYGTAFSPLPSDIYAATFFDCTYVNVASTPTFDYHHAFVTGYMSASWTTTTLSGAAYAISGWREHNLYLGMSDYSYSTDYTKRWFMFDCYKVSGGVVSGQAISVLVEYSFVSGSAPAVLQFIDESGWDTAYSAYGTTIGDTSVVNGSMVPPRGGNNTDLYINDNGLYDSTTNSFWWSGACNNSVGGGSSPPSGPMYYLNSFFTPRATMNTGFDQSLGRSPGQAPNPPFLKLSFSSPTPPPTKKRRLGAELGPVRRFSR